MPKGKWIERGELGPLVHSEIRSWPINKLALWRWAALTMMYGRNTIHCRSELVGFGADSADTRACTDMQKPKHTNTKSKSRSSGRANSIIVSSRQIQFPSRTYVSWLKQPTKTGEICHILKDWTQYWVLLWQWDDCSPPLALCQSLCSFLSWPFCITWCHRVSLSFFPLSLIFYFFGQSVPLLPAPLERKTGYSYALWIYMSNMFWALSIYKM